MAESQIKSFSNKIETGPEKKSDLKLKKSTIIIDVQNIAMRHGNGKFSVRGIEIVVEYWSARGHKVVGFMPEYLLDEKRVAEMVKLQKSDPESAKASKIPDNMTLLKAMHKKVWVAFNKL